MSNFDSCLFYQILYTFSYSLFNVAAIFGYHEICNYFKTIAQKENIPINEEILQESPFTEEESSFDDEESKTTPEDSGEKGNV